MNSCSTRLDWEHRMRRKMNGLTLAVFLIGGLLLLLLATSLRMVVGPASLVEGLYWAIAFATGYGAGDDPSTAAQYAFTISWILLCATFWATVLGSVTTWIGEFFER